MYPIISYHAKPTVAPPRMQHGPLWLHQYLLLARMRGCDNRRKIWKLGGNHRKIMAWWFRVSSSFAAAPSRKGKSDLIQSPMQHWHITTLRLQVSLCLFRLQVLLNYLNSIDCRGRRRKCQHMPGFTCSGFQRIQGRENWWKLPRSLSGSPTTPIQASGREAT